MEMQVSGNIFDASISVKKKKKKMMLSHCLEGQRNIDDSKL